MALLILAEIQKSQLLLWLFVGIFGFFEGRCLAEFCPHCATCDAKQKLELKRINTLTSNTGPMWPAMMSTITEDYGFELQATHTALVLCSSKIGIFCCQLLFAYLLANHERGVYFSYAFLGIIVLAGCNFAWCNLVSLPNMVAASSRKRQSVGD
eukprot:m.1194045 g.1194045  ORF g.1194045 m.1194045 type:complete len:154 (-) comp24559_c0_seq9:2097-2558(-)